jgi:hypothetical protein
MWKNGIQYHRAADVDDTKSAATATLEGPVMSRGHYKRWAGTTVSGGGAAVEEESPFVAEKARRPGLAPGQWDNTMGGAIQAEAAKQSYLEGMYYCIGSVPRKGLQSDRIYDAYVMGTRVAYWQGTAPFFVLVI